jgi:hypothetical protein
MPSWCGAQLKHRDNFTFLPGIMKNISMAQEIIVRREK